MRQLELRRRRGRPRQAKPLTPGLRDFLAAALTERGCARSVSRRLQIAERTFYGRLSALMRVGAAKRFIVHDPTRYGKPYEFRVLVSLDHQQRDAVESFEAWCLEDRCITAAAYICGRFDYQLTCFHADLREADRWRRAVEARPEVRKLDQRRVTTIQGHQLPGMLLIGRP